jgi:hypothetical protein
MDALSLVAAAAEEFQKHCVAVVGGVAAVPLSVTEPNLETAKRLNRNFRINAFDASIYYTPVISVIPAKLIYSD